MGESNRARLIGTLLTGGLMLVAGGCAGQTAPSLVAPHPTSTLAGSPSPSLPPAKPEAAPTVEPTIAGPHYSLVGLGDSVPGGLKCNAPCQSYVLTFGELASAALGVPVLTHNMATNDGLESDTLLSRVQHENAYRSGIAEADIITLQVGGNDWQGPCNFENHVSCLLFREKRVEPNLDAIVAELVDQRAGKPTAIRVVTYYNGFVGNKLTPSVWGFLARPSDIEQFDRDFARALSDFNAMICRVASAHGALCVDIGPAFNGPRLDQPAATGLINSDGAHALQAGQGLIAQTVAKAGFSELK